jgi:hypothetical protein
MPFRLTSNSHDPYLTSFSYWASFEDPQPKDKTNSHNTALEEPKRMYIAAPYSPYHAVELTDASVRPEKVSKWTLVALDDALGQWLLHLYFAFNHPFYCILHKEYILANMIAGRKHLCSPLLVSDLVGPSLSV